MEEDLELDFFLDFLDSAAENQSQKEKFRLKEGERREVCILFADVKNSTVMGSQLDPEAFQSKLDPLMKRFTKCITHYGGFVDKYMGDGIMALFGAKKATEQDTERAVLAGLKMLEQLELYNRKILNEDKDSNETVGLRIGINTGLVIAGKVGEEREGDFTVTGSAVHLAQRMEANAPVGKILLPLHVMQAVERFFEFEFFANVSAKGFAAPIESYCVIRPRSEKGQRWYRKKSVYIGRDRERQFLDRALAHLERKMEGIDDGGEAVSIIGIKGDAGLGKTRLVHEFYLANKGRIKLISCATSGIIRTPFYLFINLLENEFKLSISESLSIKKQKLEAGLKALAQNLEPEEADKLHDALPLVGALLEIPYSDIRLKQNGQELLIHLRLAMQNMIRQILLQHSKAGLPIVLVLDDLHWMDESSAAIFGNLIQNLILKKDLSEQETGGNLLPQEMQASLHNKILLIMQYRTDYTVPAAISSQSEFKELELNPLNDIEILSLLKFHTDAYTIPDEILNKVKLLSMGNPFYLEEWCNYLSDLPKYDLKDLPIPANLHALILSRLDMLDSSIRLLLQKASVIGQEFFVDILHWIEDKLYNPIDVVGTLSLLEHQSFIFKLIGFDYSAYFFKHITTRDVAYQTLLLENRAILHKLAAEAIEELYPERQQEFLFILSDHYHRAGIADKAIYYLEKAASAAQKVYSNRQAIELYEKLLSWLLEVTQTSGLSSLGISEAEDNVFCPSPARVLLHLTEIKSLIGLWDASDNDLQQASTLATKSSDIFDCHRLMGISAFRRGNMEKALQEWQKCLELATSDFSELAAANNNLGIWYQHHKQYEQAFRHHHSSLDYAKKLNDSLRIAKTLSNLGLLYLSQKDYPNAQKHLGECLAISEANQYLQLQSIALGNLGLLHYKQGDLDQAMKFYEKKWLLVDKLDDKAELIKVLGNIGNINRDRGQHREALEYYRKVLTLKLSLGNVREIGVTHNEIALQLLELGLLADALSEVDMAIEYSQMGRTTPENQGEFLYNKACILLDMKNYDAYKEAIELAIAYSRKNKLEAVLKACLELQNTDTTIREE